MQNKKNVKKILLTGGGTGGSVSPLLAVAEELKKSPHSLAPRLPRCGGGLPRLPRLPRPGGGPGGGCGGGYQGGYNFLWIGTRNGPEKKMVDEKNIKFKPIFSGKLRRYFSWRNFIDPFFILIGFFQSLAVLSVWRPDIVISAGSFVSVPVVWAAWILRVPVLIHQQDARPGLANKLMAPFAKVVTATFEQSLRHYGKKAVWTGNPVRSGLTKDDKKPPLITAATATARATARAGQAGQAGREGVGGLLNNLPTVLIIGGGTGATAINELVWQSLDKLTEFCQVIHITGKGKDRRQTTDDRRQNYYSYNFLNTEQMAAAYAAADIVVSRAGMGVLTELSRLGKPAVLIPMPDSHQEDNAEIFKEKGAAIVLSQKELTPETFTENIKKLLDNGPLRLKLSDNIKKVIKSGADEKIVRIIKEIIKK